MSTALLFRTEPYRRSFSAHVLECKPELDGAFLVLLDQTCFYPEGGGQPADIGTLGSARVLDTRERAHAVWHTTNAPLAVGALVEGEIDWAHRFSLMQHHTAEHIVSGLVHSLYQLDNVGFHMGSAMVTIDFNGELSLQAIERIELLANHVVFKNLAVEIDHPTAAALETMQFRSKKSLSSLEGEIRIVTVPAADRCACCGIHVAHTGELGCIRLLPPQRYKGGVRVGLLCAEAALLDAREKDAQVLAISQLLSAKPLETADAVRRLLSQNEALRSAADEAKRQLFALRATALAGRERVCLFDAALTPGDLRPQATALLEAGVPLVLVASGETADGDHRYALGSTSDARPLSKALHATLGGKGGGSATLVQGSFAASRAAIEAAFDTLAL